MVAKKSQKPIPPNPPLRYAGDYATRLPLHLDIAGLFYVEAYKRIQRGCKHLSQLRQELKKHQARVAQAREMPDEELADDSWLGVILEVGSLEPLFGRTIRELAVGDLLLVAAAESYINSIANEVLMGTELDNFDKLTPVGKWLFLPQIMKLDWVPSLGSGSLQKFGALVSRRNKFVHPKPIKVGSASEADQLLLQLKLEVKTAQDGADSVRDLFQKISNSWADRGGPDWLRAKGAAKNPPCFYAGSAKHPMRLGKKS